MARDLPLRVDTALAEGIVAAALAQLPAHVPALALPTQAIGLSGEHQAFAGTLSLQPATLLALWGDIGAGVARAGVKKLLLFNAHGGNVSSMDIVARQLRQQHGLLVVHCSWFNLPLPQEVHAAFSAHEHRFGVHAGEVETSMLLHFGSSKCRWRGRKILPPPPATRPSVLPFWATAKAPNWAGPCRTTTPPGQRAMPPRPMPSAGRRWSKLRRQGLAQLLQEMHQLPLDTVGPAY